MVVKVFKSEFEATPSTCGNEGQEAGAWIRAWKVEKEEGDVKEFAGLVHEEELENFPLDLSVKYAEEKMVDRRMERAGMKRKADDLVEEIHGKAFKKTLLQRYSKSEFVSNSQNDLGTMIK